MKTEKASNNNGRILFRITICCAILLVGTGAMIVLAKMKKPPVEVAIAEQTLRVDTLLAKSEDILVKITGFGQVQVVNKVSLSTEVPGRVVAIHPRLEEGEIIKKGEILFKIDPSDYLTTLDGARADMERVKSQIELVNKQLELDRERLKTLERNKNLAKADYERQHKLFFKENIGSLSDVEKLEQAYNAVFDQAAQMAKAVDLYPMQISESKNSLIAAESRLAAAKKNLLRCEVKAPFIGRLASVSVETGQYVAPGQKILVFADDSSLEIPVSVDSVEAKKWLRFKPGQAAGWLQQIEPVECEIRWTEDDTIVWKGRLHRAIRFDPATRTLIVAVRLDKGNNELLSQGQLPLVEGMFCSVTIPGRMMEGVYRLPRWAVSYKNTLYLAHDNRLKTSNVNVVKTVGEETFVSDGLHDGDQVIITRLVDPLENSKLEILNNQAKDNKSEEKS